MDTYNPAVATDVLNSRFCNDCGKYFSSKKWKDDHRKVNHPRRRGGDRGRGRRANSGRSRSRARRGGRGNGRR